MKTVDDAWDEAWELIHDEAEWKEEKKSDAGDVVMSRKSKKGRPS